MTWERPSQSDTRFRRYLVHALLRSGVCVILEDGRSDYVFVANLFDAWSLSGDSPPSDLSLFGPNLAEELAALKAEVRRTGEPGKMDVVIAPERHFQFNIEAIPSSDDVDLMTTIIDYTEERKREHVLRDLLREVSHRSKNLLAIIQSIAAQTARHSVGIDEFLQKFRGRLYSLSLSQDLITDSLWRGATFHDLVQEQLARYLPDAGGNVEVVGGDILFPPTAALHIGLAVHELIMNTVTHADLSNPEAKILISCHRETVGEKAMIHFAWRETRPFALEAITTDEAKNVPHFGRSVLERVLPASVMGEATYEIGDHDIVYTLVFPETVDAQ